MLDHSFSGDISMNEDLIQLPEVKEIKEMLVTVRHDVQEEVEKDSELIPLSKLLLQVMDMIDEKVAKHKDLNKLNVKEKIDVAAYLSFLQGLQEDFFFYDEGMEEGWDEEDSDGWDELDEESFEEK